MWASDSWAFHRFVVYCEGVHSDLVLDVVHDELDRSTGAFEAGNRSIHPTLTRPGRPGSRGFPADVDWCSGSFRTTWPRSTIEPWSGERTVPSAHARVVGTTLHLWFGGADAPDLECEPIDLTLWTD